MLWSQTNEIFFTATNTANLSTGTVSATNATITNLTLNIAVDQNFITNKMLDNTLSRKLSVMVPWTWHQIVSTTSGTLQNPTFNITGGDGRWLQKIYYAPYSTSFATGVNTFNVYNHSNLGCDQTTIRFITLIDSKPLQVGLQLVTGNRDDYIRRKDKLRGSCIQSSNKYYYNWCYVDDFTDKTIRFDDLMCENSIDRIILSNILRRYQVQSQVVDSSYNHRFYFVT